MHRALLLSLTLLALTVACEDKPTPTAPASETPAPKADEPEQPTAAPDDAPTAKRNDLGKGLLLAYSQFDGAKPGAARVEMLIPEQGGFKAVPLEDPDSNVFHKALVHAPAGKPPSLFTLAGMKASVKQWKKSPTGFKPETVWTEAFGGKFDRMRDGEFADLYGDGTLSLAIATHDQGVVAVLRPEGDGWKVEKLDRTADTFIHEIEIGDLNADKVLEVYATPSEPNRLDATHQSGRVVRYVPKLGEAGKRQVVADLKKRHAKEILVDDVDGDGKDELYVAVEAATKGDRKNVQIVEPVEIRRYDADTPADKGVVVATIDDRFCRFLTAGDVDGDGKKELVAAAFRSGVWLMRPGTDPKGQWSIENIDRESSGFEHAALLTDLDGDGTDELYVAADEQGEVRRYTWKDGKATRETIHRLAKPKAMLTWNIMPLPPELFP